AMGVLARGFTTSLSTESSDASQRDRGQCRAHRPRHGRGTARDFVDCFRTLSCANCDRLKEHIADTTSVVLYAEGALSDQQTFHVIGLCPLLGVQTSGLLRNL